MNTATQTHFVDTLGRRVYLESGKVVQLSNPAIDWTFIDGTVEDEIKQFLTEQGVIRAQDGLQFGLW
ncbi:MAG: hypothetical protein GJ680_18290 [Alteromonadaceae bacterium]|nr:hypothetical protein [Alteromonadaceae bacterium]